MPALAVNEFFDALVRLTERWPYYQAGFASDATDQGIRQNRVEMHAKVF